MPTSEQIRAEIERAFGFLPPFFEPALGSPQVLGNLWQQTLSAYVLNPLSALFKERLNALLSRFCAAPYCMIVHSAALRPLGMTAQQVLTLLDAPARDQEKAPLLGVLPVPAPEEAAAPTPDSPLEQALLFCATAVFLERAEAAVCQAELRRLLGPDLYPHLVAYLAYIKTCHTWIEAHPEVSFEADRRAQDSLGPLLAEEPALGDFFRHYQERVGAQRLGREDRRIAEETLRAEQARTNSILESITDAFFTLDRDWNITRVNDQAERLMTKKRAQTLGRNIWDTFPNLIGSVFEREYRRAMEEKVAVSFDVYYPPLDAWLEVRAFPSSDGLSVFYQDVSRRKEAEAERERLLDEQRSRAEREALLNRVGQSLRASTDPQTVQKKAANLLGSALKADRCFYVTYDLARDHARVFQDWRRDDLPSLAGDYRASDFRALLGELFPTQRTAVVGDVRAALSPAVASVFEASRHRAVLVVPFFEVAGLVAALYVSMADAPRVWTVEEITLAEQVATMTRSSVEAALVQEREHHIAQQLQDALQPAPPEHITGLSVGRFTRPALDEAQIGGDFYDIFPLEKKMYALVIGDVSGKGLAAAQQLALIRNSLRTTLYLYRSPAQAAAALNAIVTAHDLLVGFVTVWVGVYDAALGQIVYCSCGHEPGLVRRTGGAVVALETMGPPLGIAEDADYSEQSFTLTAGDALLLYTDGISEAGPNRRELLGTEGLTHLLGTLPTGLSAQAEAETLVRKVSAYAGGAFRDDVAVLLAHRQ